MSFVVLAWPISSHVVWGDLLWKSKLRNTRSTQGHVLVFEEKKSLMFVILHYPTLCPFCRIFPWKRRRGRQDKRKNCNILFSDPFFFFLLLKWILCQHLSRVLASQQFRNWTSSCCWDREADVRKTRCENCSTGKVEFLCDLSTPERQ